MARRSSMDAVRVWVAEDLPVSPDGAVAVTEPAASTLQAANSETGILQDLPEGLAVSDWTQAFGKLPMAFDWSGIDMALISAHKIGGPKGIGALILRRGLDMTARIRGGGQEMGRRSGTENPDRHCRIWCGQHRQAYRMLRTVLGTASRNLEIF